MSRRVNPKKILMNLKYDKDLTFNITEYKRNDSNLVFNINKFLAYFEEWNPNTNLIEDM